LRFEGGLRWFSGGVGGGVSVMDGWWVVGELGDWNVLFFGGDLRGDDFGIV